MKDINVIEDKVVEPEKKRSVHNVLSVLLLTENIQFTCVLIFFSLTRFLK